MTPKEKAKELVLKFGSELPTTKIQETYLSAKQCALIAVEVILKDVLTEPDGTILQYAFNAYQYWREVKQEIEKL